MARRECDMNARGLRRCLDVELRRSDHHCQRSDEAEGDHRAILWHQHCKPLVLRKLLAIGGWRTLQKMSLPVGVIVRRGRPGDAAHVLALIEQLGYSPKERQYDETFAQVVRHPEAAVFVAADGLKVIGYLAMSQRPQIRLGGRIAVIDELVVDERRRGDGIGSALLEAALKHAGDLGCRRMELNTSRARDSYGRRFYSSHGFVEVDSAVMRIDPLPSPARATKHT